MVLVYVDVDKGGNKSGDRLAASQAIAAATILISWSLGAYVLIRRERRGPQH